MKTIITREFRDYEDRAELEMYIAYQLHGPKLFSALWDISEKIRSCLKHGLNVSEREKLPEKYEELLEDLRSEAGDALSYFDE